MIPWSRTMRLALVCLLGGLLGAYLLCEWAMPFRAGDTRAVLGPNAVAMLPLTLLTGAFLGAFQWRLACRWRRWRTAAVVTMVFGTMALLVVDFFVEFTRAFPVPGGGPGLNPSVGELKAGLVYWGAFVVGAVAANFMAHVIAAKRALT